MSKKLLFCLIILLLSGCGVRPEVTCSILAEMLNEVGRDLGKQQESGPFNVDLYFRGPEDMPRRFQTVWKSPDELTSESDLNEEDYLVSFFTFAKPDYSGWLGCRRMGLHHDNSGEHQELLECTLEKLERRQEADEQFKRISAMLDQCSEQFGMSSGIGSDEMHTIYGPGTVQGDYKLIGKQTVSGDMETTSIVWLKYSALSKDRLILNISAVKKVKNLTEQGGIYK
jgi:hypothetical protein